MSATKEHHHDQIEAGQRGKQHPIGWLNMPGFKPETWNPIVGCTKVSPGCDNCYAEKMANRLTGIKATKDNYSPVISNGKWNGNTSVCLNQWNWPLVWKTPRMVFVCSMSDLFHESVFSGMFQMVLDRISRYRQHIFIILTKRPENVMPLMKRVGWGLPFPPNVWIGVTAENQEQANKRIPILLQIPAAKRFVSIEPMLGPVDLTAIRPFICETITQNVLSGFATNQTRSLRDGLPVLDWVICGGESGPKARPMHPDWISSIRYQCKAASVPFFFKQWGEWRKHSQTNMLEVYANSGKHPSDFNYYGYKLNINPFGDWIKVGRKAAGDMLDGKQHHEWPKINL